MNPPKITDDYGHGQMMGMLVIITMLENAVDANDLLKSSMIQKVKDIANRDLAQYLNSPEEDVLLLVNEQLRNI